MAYIHCSESSCDIGVNIYFPSLSVSFRAASSGPSAVCAFSLTDIKAAFSGDYKTLDLNGYHWTRQPNVDGKLGKVTQTKRANSIYTINIQVHLKKLDYGEKVHFVL